MMRILACVIFCFLTIGQPAMAQDDDAAEKMIKHTLDQVISVLQKKDLPQEDKNSRIVRIVTPMFDFSRMAKLTLGRQYWPHMSKEKQERFTDLFIKRLKESYRDKLVLYKDQKVVYEPPVRVKAKLRIPTHLVSEDNRISILYKLYKPEKNWKIYDLEIQGVSLIRSYRSQFREILQSGTIDDLLLKLEKPADS